ncbi:MAG: DNA repair protein RecN [Pseudomonadota bacterium]
MLRSFSVRNIVLIHSLDLELDAGMTVLTGETGAGKSILLDALSLALGARGDAGLVRSGCDVGEVRAQFDLPNEHPAHSLLKEAGLGSEGELIIRRVQSSDGRTRAFVNDQPASVSMLQALRPTLVEIHGQHDDRALIDQEQHRALLDAFGGLQNATEDLRQAHALVLKARIARDEAMGLLEQSKREADYLRASVDELTALAVEPGEEQALVERRAFMMQAEKVASDLQEAEEIVSGSSAPTPELASLMRRLERKGPETQAMLGPIIEALGRSLDALGDAAMEVNRAIQSLEFDPGELNAVEERLFALRAAARKFQVTCDELPQICARFADRLDEIDASTERLNSLEQSLRDVEQVYHVQARGVSERRQATGAFLSEAVERELPDLKLGQARFMVKIDTDPSIVGAQGYDRVSFEVQTNPGARAGPILKVASGGELSRFLLALKVVLAEQGSAPTLVFDEIDSGAGGAVAEAIGVRLARLAETVQVLSVTHAPQVAARASGHLSISKSVEDENSTLTNVEQLDSNGRLEEVARMLSGARVTDEARAAADRLLRGGEG